MRILLIEDDADDVKLVRRQLAATGWEIVDVVTAQAAVDAIKSKEFDVILLDLNLPNGVGVDLVQRIAKEAGNVPLVVLTGFDANDELALGCVRAGAAGYASKNLLQRTRSMLLAQIELALSHRLKTIDSAAMDLANSIVSHLNEVRRFAQAAKEEMSAGLQEIQKATQPQNGTSNAP